MSIPLTCTEIAERTAKWLDVSFKKVHMSETALAAQFEEATYHIEHHNFDLNYVGKYALSEIPSTEGYKVVLTGEGADEQFGGYPVYLPDFLRATDSAANVDIRVPEEVRKQLVQEQDSIIEDAYRGMGATISQFSDTTSRASLGDLITPPAMAAFVPAPTLFKPEFPVHNVLETIRNNIPPHVQTLIREKWHPLNSAMYIWTKGHLVNQFLSCLGDRVEMAHSIEARTPFLDHIFTEYVNGIPTSMKIRYDAQAEGTSSFIEKYALREAVKPFVTPEIYARRKHPYSAPSRYPLHGPLHSMMIRIVTRENVEALGFIDWDEAQKMLQVAFAPDIDVRDVKDIWAWRQVLLIAQWIVIGQRFRVKKAVAPLSCQNGSV